MRMMILQVFAMLTQFYPKSCRSEQFYLNCPSVQLSRGWFKISPLKSLIQWLPGEILQYNLKKLIHFLMWRLFSVYKRDLHAFVPHFTSWVFFDNASKQGCNQCILPFSLQKWDKTVLKACLATKSEAFTCSCSCQFHAYCWSEGNVQNTNSYYKKPNQFSK